MNMFPRYSETVITAIECSPENELRIKYDVKFGELKDKVTNDCEVKVNTSIAHPDGAIFYVVYSSPYTVDENGAINGKSPKAIAMEEDLRNNREKFAELTGMVINGG